MNFFLNGKPEIEMNTFEAKDDDGKEEEGIEIDT